MQCSFRERANLSPLCGRRSTLASLQGSGLVVDQGTRQGRKGCVASIGQDGLFNIPQLGCVSSTQHDHWRNVVYDGVCKWLWRLAQLCKVNTTGMIEAKNRKKVAWETRSCQKDFQKCVPYKQFSALTSDEEVHDCVDRRRAGTQTRRKGERHEDARQSAGRSFWQVRQWRRVSSVTAARTYQIMVFMSQLNSDTVSVGNIRLPLWSTIR